MRRFLVGSAMLTLAFVLAACEREPDPTLARMLAQRRGDPFAATPAFPDGKVMRAPVAGTVPRDDDTDDERPPLDRELVLLGRARYDVACALCHGVAGDGRSYVAEKMELRRPPSLVGDPTFTEERVFEVTTSGYGLMPSLAAHLSHRERWAIAAYVHALQLRRTHASALAPLPGPR
ncbi:MAG: cytochrome c [Labilithrix sp.]|nr:cytochrome c [Labilithrix sp.]MCW5815675.1 cytochrome c [Labilithrix sp.]